MSRRAERGAIVVVGAEMRLGGALIKAWRERGGVAAGYETGQGAGRLERIVDRLGAAGVFIDTSAWWGEADAQQAWDRAVREYEECLEAATAREIGALVVTSAATCGWPMERGEASEYVPGRGEAWEEGAWEMESRAYGAMSMGAARVWIAQPTIVLGGSGGLDVAARRWRQGGYHLGGDVIAAQDAARGCLAAWERGRAGRRYLLSGEWVSGERAEAIWGGGQSREGVGAGLGGRRYEGVERASGELGHGSRRGAEEVMGEEQDAL